MCDVGDRAQVEHVVPELVEALGGLDVIVANAGVAAHLPLLGGDPAIMEGTLRVNVLGVYYTLRTAGPHIAHKNGYALAIASRAAALHAPLLGAYSASKAAVEALGNTLRIELRSSGARVGVGYFSKLDTDMARRGLDSRAASGIAFSSLMGVTPVEVAISALERGIARRARRIVAPRWVGPQLSLRMPLQRVVDIAAQRGLAETLEIAREEHAPLTTPQPDETVQLCTPHC
jgi:NAD(P)-dependent dehydrogenase (short-subunit alcohol dehydrogenase family)